MEDQEPQLFPPVLVFLIKHPGQNIPWEQQNIEVQREKKKNIKNVELNELQMKVCAES